MLCSCTRQQSSAAHPTPAVQALERGLVDRLGGLAEALDLAKEQAGLPLEEGAVRVKQVGAGSSRG